MSNFRRSQRFPFKLDVLLHGQMRPTPTTTDDVSFHGVFIRTDEERVPNQLIKFTVIDPRDGERLELMGIVARCITSAERTSSRAPGIGISLFGNDRSTEALWVAVIRQVKVWVEHGMKAPPPAGPQAPALSPSPDALSGVARPAPRNQTPVPSPVPASRTVVLPAPSDLKDVAPPRVGPIPVAAPPPPPATPAIAQGIDATRREHVRRPGKFNVTLRPEGLAALQQFELKDISEGGTFVLSATLISLSSRVNLRLVHPHSGETFQIAGHVARTVDSLDETEKGIGIKFDMPRVDRSLWAKFVGRHAPVQTGGVDVLPTEPSLGVRVHRTATEPSILLGLREAPVPAGGADGDPGGPPIVLDAREVPVALLLGEGLSRPPTVDLTRPPTVDLTRPPTVDLTRPPTVDLTRPPTVGPPPRMPPLPAGLPPLPAVMPPLPAVGPPRKP